MDRPAIVVATCRTGLCSPSTALSLGSPTRVLCHLSTSSSPAVLILKTPTLLPSVLVVMLKIALCFFAGAAWAGTERDVVLVDSQHFEHRRVCWSCGYLVAVEKDLHQVLINGQPLSVCLWRATVWSGRVWLDAACWFVPIFKGLHQKDQWKDHFHCSV